MTIQPGAAAVRIMAAFAAVPAGARNAAMAPPARLAPATRNPHPQRQIPMDKACASCGYTRKPIELAPETECPHCGIIYAKYGRTRQEPAQPPANTHLADAALPVHAPLKPEPLPAPIRNILLFIATAFALAFLSVPYRAARDEDTRRKQADEQQARAEQERRAGERAEQQERRRAEREARERDPAYQEQQRRSEAESLASLACWDAIRSKEPYPSSVDFRWLWGTARKTLPDGTIAVSTEYTALNVLGNAIPLRGDCVVKNGQTISVRRHPR
jgi:predicted RNA-binding Zn-ribbon protein involved in translation (DUF1610 family)